MENRALGKSIAILHRREQKYMISKMKELGIGYSGYNFLLYLEIHSGSSQKEMCEALAVDEALAVRTMKRLEETGFIIRKKSEKKRKMLRNSSDRKGGRHRSKAEIVFVSVVESGNPVFNRRRKRHFAVKP